jgi:hypothetical protein
MSNTIAHMPHVHHRAPLAPVLAVIVTVAIATVLIWAVNQPQTTIATGGSTAVTAPAVQPLAAPAPDSPVFRHAQMRVLQNGAYPQAYLTGRLHQVEGTTLDPLGTTPYTAPARREFGALGSVR